MAITSPNRSFLATILPQITLRGVARGSANGWTVQWTSSRGASGQAMVGGDGTNGYTWEVTGAPLLPGFNTFTITVQQGSSAAATTQLTILYFE